MANSTTKPATGKLGVMVVGLGAVSTTFMTGVFMVRKGLAKPIGLPANEIPYFGKRCSKVTSQNQSPFTTSGSLERRFHSASLL